jgi:ribosomal protein S18 acetylase RimI-like enzyme
MRGARPEDKRAVLEFTRRTWGQYGDFIPRVWDRWMRQRCGRLIIAELGGVPVGMAKITDFGEGEIWLEGLRVDPRFRGKGIARAINVEVVDSLRKLKPRAVRYCTGASNRASRHIGETFGFKIAARFRYYWRKARQGTLRGEFARQADAGAICDFMRSSSFLRLSAGLVGEGWIFREFRPDRLRDYIKSRSVMTIKRSGRLVGVAVYAYEVNDRSLSVGFIDGDRASIRALARNCPHLAKVRGHGFCSMSIPSRHFPAIVDGAGFKRKDSMGQIVLEYANPASLARRPRAK